MEVRIQKAAMDLGILPSVLIQHIKEGELTGRKQGRIWYVELPEKKRELAPLKSQLAKMDQKELGVEEPPTRELIETLRRQTESQANQLKIKDRQIRELHILLQHSLRNRRKPGWPLSYGIKVE